MEDPLDDRYLEEACSSSEGEVLDIGERWNFHNLSYTEEIYRPESESYFTFRSVK